MKSISFCRGKSCIGPYGLILRTAITKPATSTTAAGAAVAAAAKAIEIARQPALLGRLPHHCVCWSFGSASFAEAGYFWPQ